MTKDEAGFAYAFLKAHACVQRHTGEIKMAGGCCGQVESSLSLLPYDAFPKQNPPRAPRNFYAGYRPFKLEHYTSFYVSEENTPFVFQFYEHQPNDGYKT